MSCKPQYPVDYDYVRGMLIMHKPWHKNKTLNKLLKNKQNTINEFLRMIDAKEVPTSVQAQYLTALKYATNKTNRLEVLMKEGVNHPDIEDKNNDEETNERITGWLHRSRLTDKKSLSDSINNVTVDIGNNKDWSITIMNKRARQPLTGRSTSHKSPTCITTTINQLVLTKLYKKWRGVFNQFIGIRTKKSSPGCDRHYN